MDTPRPPKAHRKPKGARPGAAPPTAFLPFQRQMPDKCPKNRIIAPVFPILCLNPPPWPHHSLIPTPRPRLFFQRNIGRHFPHRPRELDSCAHWNGAQPRQRTKTYGPVPSPPEIGPKKKRPGIHSRALLVTVLKPSNGFRHRLRAACAGSWHRCQSCTSANWSLRSAHSCPRTSCPSR